MQDTPPRRSRRRGPSDNNASLPIVPIIIGVVVFGFVIGAGLSVAGRGGWPLGGGATPVVTASPASRLSQAPPPVRLAPPRMPPTPRRTATAVPTERASKRPATAAPTASPEPSRSPAATPSGAASRGPVATPSLSTRAPSPAAVPSKLTPVLAPTVRPTPAATLRPTPAATLRPTPAATLRPTPGVTLGATPAATLHPTPAATPLRETPTATPASLPPAPAATEQDDVSGVFAAQAASVVRAYLAAVARGDVPGATARLAAPPRDGALPEAGIVTPAARITHLQARSVSTAAVVNVDLLTAAGPYAAQFTVHRNAAGTPLIVAHSILKL